MADLSNTLINPSRMEGYANMATISLDENGLIQACSSSCEMLFGYKRSELLGHPLSMLLPKLEGIALVVGKEINPRLKYLCHCAIPFLARRCDGEYFAGEVFFNRLHNTDQDLQVIVRNLGMMPS